MKPNATVMSSCARLPAFAALAFAIFAAPAHAHQQEGVSVNSEPDARDVAMTPLTDLNLSQDEIPPVLLAAGADTYASEGLKTCEDIGDAIAAIDAVLGPDSDVVEEESDRISWGRIATSAVGSFIPFRSVLRELTGAAEHKRDFQAAIVAGAVRRGFLKGLGQQKGCAYPARPAFTKVAAPQRAAERGEERKDGVTFVSEPVVQDISEGRPRRK